MLKRDYLTLILKKLLLEEIDNRVELNMVNKNSFILIYHKYNKIIKHISCQIPDLKEYLLIFIIYSPHHLFSCISKLCRIFFLPILSSK